MGFFYFLAGSIGAPGEPRPSQQTEEEEAPTTESPPRPSSPLPLPDSGPDLQQEDPAGEAAGELLEDIPAVGMSAAVKSLIAREVGVEEKEALPSMQASEEKVQQDYSKQHHQWVELMFCVSYFFVCLPAQAKFLLYRLSRKNQQQKRRDLKTCQRRRPLLPPARL